MFALVTVLLIVACFNDVFPPWLALTIPDRPERRGVLVLLDYAYIRQA